MTLYELKSLRPGTMIVCSHDYGHLFRFIGILSETAHHPVIAIEANSKIQCVLTCDSVLGLASPEDVADWVAERMTK